MLAQNARNYPRIKFSGSLDGQGIDRVLLASDLSGFVVDLDLADVIKATLCVLLEERPRGLLCGHRPGFDAVLILNAARTVRGDVNLVHDAGLVDLGLAGASHLYIIDLNRVEVFTAHAVLQDLTAVSLLFGVELELMQLALACR